MAPPTPSSHRPRKRRKYPTGSNNSLILEAEGGKSSPAFPLVSFLWAARAGVSQWLVLPLILMVVGLFRWAVSLWGYSGLCTACMLRICVQVHVADIFLQVFRCLRCMVISKRKDTGWSSPSTSPCRNGISTTCSTGDLTTRL
jgi:hypothetical protein